MANFSKKYKLSEYDSSYQISVVGAVSGRKAVITKFATNKKWSVAFWYSDKLAKADHVKILPSFSAAKIHAENHVDLI